MNGHSLSDLCVPSVRSAACIHWVGAGLPVLNGVLQSLQLLTGHCTRENWLQAVVYELQALEEVTRLQYVTWQKQARWPGMKSKLFWTKHCSSTAGIPRFLTIGSDVMMYMLPRSSFAFSHVFLLRSNVVSSCIEIPSAFPKTRSSKHDSSTKLGYSSESTSSTCQFRHDWSHGSLPFLMAQIHHKVQSLLRMVLQTENQRVQQLQFQQMHGPLLHGLLANMLCP